MSLEVDYCNTEDVHNGQGYIARKCKVTVQKLDMSDSSCLSISSLSTTLGIHPKLPHLPDRELGGNPYSAAHSSRLGGAVMRPISGLIAWAIDLTLAQLSDPNIYLA